MVSSEVLGVDDAGAEVLAGLQAHGGGEPAAAGPRGLVAEGGAARAAGVLGVDDGRALVAQGPVAWLQVDLGLVVTPGAVGRRHHHRLAEVDGHGHGRAVDMLAVVAFRRVPHGRVEPEWRMGMNRTKRGMRRYDS